MQDYQRGNYREITPNAGPRVAHGADVFMNVDFIWWKAVQGGNDFLVSSTMIDSPKIRVTELATKASVPRDTRQNTSENWSPGFKVGLGLNMGHDGWDVYTQYTWLNSSSDRTLDSDVYLRLYPFPAAAVPGIQQAAALAEKGKIDKISSDWSLRFNVIDLELGRNFYLSQFLTMRPFIGLKGTWQDQSLGIQTMLQKDSVFVVQYDAGDNKAEFTGPYKADSIMKNGGIGVRTGFNMSWKMTKNWSLYSDLAWSSMWTQYTQLSRKDKISNATKPEAFKKMGEVVVLDENSDKFYAVRDVMELELGMRWEAWMSDDNYYLAFQAGWEQQVWNNWGTGLLSSYYRPYAEHLSPYRNAQGWNDLSFQGLNVKLRFDF